MELHFSKKDFYIEWYSGQGAGGQHRNRHKNCCRIVHIASGLKAVGTESRSAEQNKQAAFRTLAKRVIAYYQVSNHVRAPSEVVRNYHAVRNEVHDKATGFKMTYKEVVEDNNLGPMIEKRNAHGK